MIDDDIPPLCFCVFFIKENKKHFQWTSVDVLRVKTVHAVPKHLKDGPGSKIVQNRSISCLGWHPASQGPSELQIETPMLKLRF